MSYYNDYSSDASSEYDTYDESSIEEMSFGEGIEVALNEISNESQELMLMKRHAQIILNTFMKTLCDHNPDFKKVFGGLSSADSFLDDIQFWSNSPEYDLNIELRLPLSLQAVCADDFPGFVFLNIIGGDQTWCHHFGEQYYGKSYIDRLQLQIWLSKCLSNAMDQLAYVNVSRRRAYSLKYITLGDAHGLKAVDTSGRGRIIYFRFAPSIKFAANQWPRGLNKKPNKNRDWYAVPRSYNTANCQNDKRSFIISAPDWEHLALHNKYNLKNSLRLMQAFRQANGMHGLVSYMLKSIYLNEIYEYPQCNWIQSPGDLLIQMMFELKKCLLKNYIPFYLDPSHNCLDQLKESDRREYLRHTNRCLNKLRRRQKADYLTDDDLNEFFGV